jgi:hypothetical protein
MLKRLTISSPSNGSETDLRVPFPVGHELWALWAAGLIDSTTAVLSEEETSLILSPHPLNDINPCRIEEIVDDNTDDSAPAIALSTDSSNLDLPENRESRASALVPFAASFSDPIIEPSIPEDSIPAVVQIVRAKVRYLPNHLNDRNSSRARRKWDKPVSTNNLFGRSG